MENIYIQMTDGKGKSSFHNIPLQSTLTVGKSEECDVIIAGKEVGAIHAIIESYGADSIYIRSLNPKNRVTVNGKPIDRAKLSFSDIIKIGNSEFQIKKVEVHETFPEIESKKEVAHAPIEKTPPKTVHTADKKEDKAKEIFTTPISDDEIEDSIHIPEAKEPFVQAEITEVEAGPDDLEDRTIDSIKTKESQTKRPEKEPTIVRKVIRSSSSLRIKHYWYDILLSDNLYPLSESITIGHGKRNTYIVPPNGLPKYFSLFLFEEMHPFLGYHGKLDGKLFTKGSSIPLDKAKERLNVTSLKGGAYKIALNFEDKGEINYQNMKFDFEFVETPAPAARDKLFSRMDKLYKRTLVAASVLFLILFLFFFIITPVTRGVEKKEVRLAMPGANLAPVIRVTPTPKPQPVRAGGGRQGTEGEGARAFGEEGRRGKSVPGKKGPSQIDIIREQGVGALMFFKSSTAFQDIAGGGGGGDLDSATRRMRPGLPGETVERRGLGLRDMGGTGGGGKTFVGSGMGLGEKGKGLGRKGTGTADWGTKGEAQVSVSGLDEEKLFQGDMDPSIIEKIIRDNLGYIKWCYERELNQTPELSGKIVVDFVIGVEGAVTASSIKNTTMRNVNVESCISRRIRTLKFPKPGAGVVQVYYPFIFRVAGGL